MTHQEFVEAVTKLLKHNLKQFASDRLIEIYETWSEHKGTEHSRNEVYHAIESSFDWDTTA